MINYKITPQNFEIIRDRIGAILTLEFENQSANYYNTDCEGVGIFIERNDPTNLTHLPLISVNTTQGTYDNRHAGYVDGKYTYDIWIYTNAKTTSNDSGAKLSAIKMQRLMGICRAIMEDPIYKTLGFTPGSIGNLRVTGFEVGTLKKLEEDALSTSAGKLSIELKAEETSVLITAAALEEALTQITLGLTDEGYKYEFIDT